MKKTVLYLICLILGTGLMIADIGAAQDFNGLGNPSPSPLPAPVEPKKEEPPVPIKYPPLEIKTKVDRTKFIGNQNIVFRAEIIFRQEVNPFWEKLKEIDLSPFRIERITVSERKIYESDKELTRDAREVVFLLSLPASSENKIYSIPSFSLKYSYFKREKEVIGSVKTKTVKVKKVPILITASIDKDVLVIGEPNVLRLTIWREKTVKILNYELKDNPDISDIEKEGFRRWLKSLEVREQKISDLQKPEFPNFKILEKSFRTENQGPVIKETFEYRFAFYELPGKEFKIPSFHIWYLDNSKEKSQKPIEIKTFPQVVKINSLIRADRQSLEGLKPPSLASGKNIYIFGYGPMALGAVLFLIFTVSAGKRLLRHEEKNAVPTEIHESPAKIWNSLLNLQKATMIDRQLLIQIRNEFVKMLAGIIKIPESRALAKTGPEMADLFRKAGFSEELANNLKDCLKSLDAMIQDQSKEEIAAMWVKIINTANHPEIARFLKKRKIF